MSWSQVPTFKRDAQGRVFVNPEKDVIFPIEFPTDAPNQIITLAANTRVGPFTLTAQHDGPIEIFYIKVVVKNDQNVVQTDYHIDFFLEHSGKKKYLMNRDAPLIACAGDAGRPYVLPESIFLPAVQSIQVTFNNLDAAERRVEFVLGGIKYFPNAAPDKVRKELWNYTERREKTYTYFLVGDEAIILTAAEEDATYIMTMPDDTDLEILKLTGEATGAFRMSIRDLATGRSITSGAQIHCSLIFGGHIPTAMGGGIGGSGGVHPARWATSLLMRRSTQLELVVDDLSGNPNTVKPVLAGRKIAYAS
jgi:hypothetical protein